MSSFQSRTKYESCPFRTKFSWNIIFRKHPGLSDEVIVSLCKDKIEFRSVCLKKVSKRYGLRSGSAFYAVTYRWLEQISDKSFVVVVVVGISNYLNS